MDDDDAPGLDELSAAILRELAAAPNDAGMSLPRLGKHLGLGASVLMRSLSGMSHARIGGVEGPDGPRDAGGGTLERRPHRGRDAILRAAICSRDRHAAAPRLGIKDGSYPFSLRSDPMSPLLDSAATWFLDSATHERDGSFVVHLTEGLKGDERQFVEHDGETLGPYFPVEVQAGSRCVVVTFPRARATFSFDEIFDGTDPHFERGVGKFLFTASDSGFRRLVQSRTTLTSSTRARRRTPPGVLPAHRRPPVPGRVGPARGGTAGRVAPARRGADADLVRELRLARPGAHAPHDQAAGAEHGGRQPHRPQLRHHHRHAARAHAAYRAKAATP